MYLTPLLRPIFTAKARKSLAAASDAETAQSRTLKMLLSHGRHTLWGRSYRMEQISSYSDFREAVPLSPYEKLRPYVMRTIKGERNLLWPGTTRRFAQSSGTSDGKSKYIPVTDDSLRINHYRGGSEAVAHYLSHHPESRLFDGRAFILGGSFANELELPDPKVKVGDLSANLIDAINPIVNLVRVPSKQTALMADWHEKLPALVREASEADVTNISGVPSWFLTVLREVINAKGAETIHDVWPNLEVFFHGGIAFGPYMELYRGITDPSRMNYLETYNASEGFFAVQTSPDARGMMLMVDAGVFYEFLPADGSSDTPLPIWEVEAGKKYALVITAPNGLWRYPIGDVVRIESTNPVTITIAGRTKSYINVFGEEVMVYNTDAALARACREEGCKVVDYTAAPVYTSQGSKGHHQWLIEFAELPNNLDRFAATLDRCLCDENSDYQAKRSGSIFLSPLTVTVARRGLFDAWLESTGKLGGQRKVPRLCNDRHLIDSMLRFN